MQHYLITNVQYPTINNLRLCASAIVLTRDVGGCELRLFGCDPALPVASIALQSLEYSISPVTFSQYFGGYEPIQTSYSILVSGLNYDVVRIPFSTATTDGRPPVIDSYVDGSPIARVWRDLALRVVESHEAPFAPLLDHLPVESVCRIHRRTREKS